MARMGSTQVLVLEATLCFSAPGVAPACFRGGVARRSCPAGRGASVLPSGYPAAALSAGGLLC